MDLGNYYSGNQEAESLMNAMTSRAGADLLERKNAASSQDQTAQLNQRDAINHINQAFNVVDEGIIAKGLGGKGMGFLRDKMSKGINNYVLKPLKNRVVSYAKGEASLTEDLENLPERMKAGKAALGKQVNEFGKVYGKGARKFADKVASKAAGVADDVGEDAATAIGDAVPKGGTLGRMMPQIRRLGRGLGQRIQQGRGGFSRGKQALDDIRNVGDPDQADHLNADVDADDGANPFGTADAGDPIDDLGGGEAAKFEGVGQLFDDTGAINSGDGGVFQLPEADQSLGSWLEGGAKAPQYGSVADATGAIEEAAGGGGVMNAGQFADGDVEITGADTTLNFGQIDGELVGTSAKYSATALTEAGEAGEGAAGAARGAASAAQQATEGLGDTIAKSSAAFERGFARAGGRQATQAAGELAEGVAQDASSAAQQATEGLGRTIGRSVMKQAAQKASSASIDEAIKAARSAADAASKISTDTDVALGIEGAVDVADAAIPGVDILTDVGTLATAGIGYGLSRLADWVEKKTDGNTDTAAGIVGSVFRTHLGAVQTHLQQ
tara:strand:+ start:2947 stop:4614 length:1668 start_codon:yes stop_codon:yes gene_type:complete